MFLAHVWRVKCWKPDQPLNRPKSTKTLWSRMAHLRMDTLMYSLPEWLGQTESLQCLLTSKLFGPQLACKKKKNILFKLRFIFGQPLQIIVSSCLQEIPNMFFPSGSSPRTPDVAFKHLFTSTKMVQTPKTESYIATLPIHFPFEGTRESCMDLGLPSPFCPGIRLSGKPPLTPGKRPVFEKNDG